MEQSILIQLAALIGVLLGGGVGVALVAQFLKKAFGLKTDSVIHFLVVALSAVTAIAQYILALKNLPLEILGISAPTIYGFSQLAYKFSIYASDFIVKVKTKNDQPATTSTFATTVPAALQVQPVSTAATPAPFDL